MKANPGGYIPPQHVIGRDALIERFWKILERQRLIINAARRMGKTSIIKKMEAAPRGNRVLVYRDLERVETPVEFAEIVFHDVEKHLSRSKRLAQGARSLLRAISGADVAGVVKFPEVAARHWKQLLTTTVQDLVEAQKVEIVFLWDEFPMMLDNIKRSQGEPLVMEMLNVLRALRQTYADLRMVFTGSIGLHHVIAALKQHGYANAATNDMYLDEVPPLAPDDAVDLARRLMTGERISSDDPEAVAASIAQAVGNVPFYIHHVVDQLKLRGVRPTPESVRALVDECLADPMDRWDMNHWRQRIGTYYSPNQQPIALAFLDAVSAMNDPISFEASFEAVKSRLSIGDPEPVRQVLELLQRDHYVQLGTDRRYSFRHQLLQRYWHLKRGG